MKNIVRIFKKEFDKIFKFPRMIFSTLILPGLLIFLIYAFIGQSLQGEMDKMQAHESIVHIINIPDSFEFAYGLAEDYKINFTKSTEADVESLKFQLKEQKVDAVIIFEDNFDQLLANKETPKIQVLYNSYENNSNIANTKIQELIEIQKQIKYQELGINPHIFDVKTEEVVDQASGSAKTLAMILPMIIISFIFGSALSIGSDAIAGEKERGTLATILMTPIKRNEIIVGKIISTSVITIFSAFSSFIGIIASLPYAKAMFSLEGGISYTALDYIGILVILLALSVLASSILLVTSTIAKTVKEASMLAMPIYMTAIIIPAITMFSSGGNDNPILYLIPIYNTVLGFKGILGMNIDLGNFFLIIGSSVVYIGLIIFLLIKMFKNERILYSK